MQAKDLAEKAYTTGENISLAKVAQIMSSKKIGEILFLNGGEIKGIITEDDIVRNFEKNKSIKSAMTPKVITIGENESLDNALDLMNNHSIKRLPVLSGNGKLIGILRLIDIARHAHELEDDFFFG